MEKLEGIVKVSRKGQIIIPKEVREALGIYTGKKLAVIVKDDEIILRKVEKIDISEIGSRVSAIAERDNINVDELVEEAIKWAREQK